jgi:hypothetical protein
MTHGELQWTFPRPTDLYFTTFVCRNGLRVQDDAPHDTLKEAQNARPKGDLDFDHREITHYVKVESPEAGTTGGRTGAG